jgi:decaprenylphospho-beta-D-ribofuranose 2-oxidase
MRTSEELLSGWGRTSPSRATLCRVSAAELARDATWQRLRADPRGVIARGLGRSYGDAAQNGGGTVVQLVPPAEPLHLDPGTGLLTADAGVSFDEILRYVVPRGWFVPVTPGTRFVTVGGAVASDVHGKNHHVDGSFGDHVTELTLLVADGSLRRLTPDGDPDLWSATVGGMGLTGIVTRATFRLLPIETNRCVVETERLADLDTLLDRMTEGDDEHRYSVAWVDLMATGRHLGRSVLTRGDHARLADLDGHAGRDGDPLAFDPPAPTELPRGVPNVINRLSARVFNELWYRKAPSSATSLESITGFFHPLDLVGRWNRVYGRAGFLQYQFVVPPEAVDTLREIVGRIAAARQPSFLAVLKRFGPAGAGFLGFPRPGWTLTLDVPTASPGLPELLAALDRLVLDAGGRHYLAKDAVAGPTTVRAGYPGLARWRAVRQDVDPDGVWVSDQARRLDLVGRP